MGAPSDGFVGERIVELRHRDGVTQIQLAVIANASETTVRHWEKNRSRPHHEHLEAMRRRLGWTLEDLGIADDGDGDWSAELVAIAAQADDKPITTAELDRLEAFHIQWLKHHPPDEAVFTFIGDGGLGLLFHYRCGHVSGLELVAVWREIQTNRARFVRKTGIDPYAHNRKAMEQTVARVARDLVAGSEYPSRLIGEDPRSWQAEMEAIGGRAGNVAITGAELDALATDSFTDWDGKGFELSTGNHLVGQQAYTSLLGHWRDGTINALELLAAWRRLERMRWWHVVQTGADPIAELRERWFGVLARMARSLVSRSNR